MNRRDVLHWFDEHPSAIHDDPHSLVSRCERCVRRHAMEDAWLAAKAYVAERAHTWVSEWSPPASEAFVAREICHRLAYELRTHEPEVPDGAEDHLAGGSVVDRLDPEAWEILRPWVRELARDEEHRTWLQIVRFTDRRGGSLIREHGLTRERGWDERHRYTAIAAHVADILAREYSLQAHPR
jgi:hypothetical protein